MGGAGATLEEVEHCTVLSGLSQGLEPGPGFELWVLPGTTGNIVTTGNTWHYR